MLLYFCFILFAREQDIVLLNTLLLLFDATISGEIKIVKSIWQFSAQFENRTKQGICSWKACNLTRHPASQCIGMAR